VVPVTNRSVTVPVIQTGQWRFPLYRRVSGGSRYTDRSVKAPVIQTGQWRFPLYRQVSGGSRYTDWLRRRIMFTKFPYTTRTCMYTCIVVTRIPVVCLGQGKDKSMRNQAFSIPFKRSKVTAAMNALPTKEPVSKQPGL